MSLNAQGTQLYFLDPEASGGEIIEVDCLTSLDGLSAPLGEEDTSCLADLGSTVEPTMFQAGSATFTVRFDPNVESHVRLFELYRAKQKMRCAVGFSDGLDIAPTGRGLRGRTDHSGHAYVPALHRLHPGVPLVVRARHQGDQ